MASSCTGFAMQWNARKWKIRIILHPLYSVMVHGEWSRALLMKWWLWLELNIIWSHPGISLELWTSRVPVTAFVGSCPHTRSRAESRFLQGCASRQIQGFFFFWKGKKKKVKKNNCGRVPGWVTVNLRKQEQRAAPYIWVKTNWSLSPGTQTCLYTELVKKSSLKVTGDK